MSCNINLSTLIPSCEALSSVGGVRTFGYFVRRKHITGYTRAADGTITGITLVTTGALKKFETGKFQNSGSFELAASEIGKKRFGQTYLHRVYFRSQADRNAMKALMLADDVVVISPLNDNLIEIYGAGLGLDVTSATGGTGTKLDDDNTALLTLTGGEADLPVLFNTVATAAVSATSASSATTNSTSLPVVSATGITVGKAISGSGIQPGTTVVGVSSNTLTLSAPASVPASTALTVTTPDEVAFATNVDYLDALVGA